MIDILLVDDHELVRTGLRHVLANRPGCRVVGEAASGEQALEQIENLKPALVLMDVNMPGIGGIEATRRIAAEYPQVRVIAVTALSESPFPSSLHEAGALGYVSKGCPPEELFGAINTVIQGRTYICSEVARKLSLESLHGRSGSPFAQLSAREMEVLMLILAGYKPQSIANKLDVSPKTVSTYRHRILEKLGVDTDVDLTKMALRYGLLADEAT